MCACSPRGPEERRRDGGNAASEVRWRQALAVRRAAVRSSRCLPRAGIYLEDPGRCSRSGPAHRVTDAAGWAQRAREMRARLPGAHSRPTTTALPSGARLPLASDEDAAAAMADIPTRLLRNLRADVAVIDGRDVSIRSRRRE